MILARIRIGTAMFAMLVLAVNLAVCRSIYSYGRFRYDDSTAGWDQLEEFMPLGILPQAALFAAIRCRGPRRAFWVGFLTCSMIVPVARIWFEYDPPGIPDPSPPPSSVSCPVDVRLDKANAVAIIRLEPGLPPISGPNPGAGGANESVHATRGCAITRLWDNYGRFVSYYSFNYINLPVAELLRKGINGSGPLLGPVPEQTVGGWMEAITRCEDIVAVLVPQLFFAVAGGLATRAIVARWSTWRSRRSTRNQVTV